MFPFDPRLLITDIGFAFAVLGTLAAGIFVLYKSPRQTLNRIFFLYCVSVSIFLASHIVGINIVDSALSRKVLFFNLSTVITSALTAHWILALVGREKSQRKIIAVLYVVALAVVAFFLFFPDSFLLPSRPFLYFPNYYVRGEYYYFSDLFFYPVIIYTFFHAIAAYIKTDIVLRRRIRYVLIGIIYGYIVSSLPALPLYGYDFDPVLSSLVGLYVIPLVYGLVKEELMDVHVIAKQALGYSFFIGGIGVVIAAMNYLNTYLVLRAPSFSAWAVPLFSGFLALCLAGIVWKKLKQNEELKYEFITVITHKFRTPLTYLKWSVENLRRAATEEDRDKALKGIAYAERRLSELTAVLIDSAQAENKEHSYALNSVAVGVLIDRAVRETLSDVQAKKIQLRFQVDRAAYVVADENKVAYALQAVLGNAVAYTPEQGTITVSTMSSGRKMRIVVQDTGIGIDKGNLNRIFDKFYRTHEARLADTEGLGIGLFIAKNVIERQGGRIWADSEGLGKGATFTIELIRGRP